MKSKKLYLFCNLWRILRINTEQDEERPDWLQISRITRTKGVSFTFDWMAPGIYLKFKMKKTNPLDTSRFFVHLNVYFAYRYQEQTARVSVIPIPNLSSHIYRKTTHLSTCTRGPGCSKVG